MYLVLSFQGLLSVLSTIQLFVAFHIRDYYSLYPLLKGKMTEVLSSRLHWFTSSSVLLDRDGCYMYRATYICNSCYIVYAM